MKYSIVAATLSLTLLSACSTFEDVTYNAQANQQFKALTASQNEISEPLTETLLLTELVKSAELDKLINDSLTNNPSLQQTLLTLQVAEQQLTSTSSAQLPSISAQLNNSKTEGGTRQFDSELKVSWTLDIWQQLANATDAQQANVAASAFAYQGARDMLAANVMQSYIDLVQLAQLIDIEQLRVNTLKTNENIIINRYRKGLIDLKELDTAKSSTQSSQATLVSYQENYASAVRNIALLTGLKENQISYSLTYPEVKLPSEAYTALAQQNLARRPDLQQAYQTIIAGQFQHKVAYKALLPSLSISAALNNSDINVHDALFSSHSWQFLGQLTAPLFNAGKLRSEAEVAKLNAEKAYWGFQQTLLTAVNEVSNSVAQEKALSQQLVLTESALASAKRSETTYTHRYKQGTVSLIDLLQIQQNTFSLQAQVAQLQYQQLSNRISLGLSLGLGV